jgi:ribosome biogenesis GTPase
MQKGRVIEVQRVHITVALPDKNVLATVRGEFHASGDYPKVGDWVHVTLVEASEEEQAVIEEILPRSTTIERLDQETLQPQILVTNVNLIFIVMGLDGDFNISRLERYLALANQSNIAPVVVLNKADMAPDLDAQVAQVLAVASMHPVHVTVAETGEGLEALVSHIHEDTTAVLLGSSGAGKSTITNWLMGNVDQEVREVRENDSRGRHTTTTRQLFTLPKGGYLIDTPGMRELSLADSETLEQDRLVDQVESLALQCQFSNCDHDKSAGCAVLEAIEEGGLEERSLDNYYKLMREREWLQDKSGNNKARYKDQTKKRSEQAREAVNRKRLAGGR